MRLNFLRIQNLRSLADTGPIKLRPINVLVGTNSSGKSSFLRAFPLLRQSVETATTGPVLWYGRYVDFGTFEQAVRRNAEKEEITFEFGLVLERNFDPERAPMMYYPRPGLMILQDLNISFSLSLGRVTADRKTFARRMSMQIGKDHIVLESDEEGNILSLKINDLDASVQAANYSLLPSDNVLPMLIPKPGTSPRQPPNIARRFGRPYYRGPFETCLTEAFRPLFAHSMRAERRQEIAHFIGIGSAETQLAQLRSVGSGGAVFSKKVASLKSSDPVMKGIRNWLLADALPGLLVEIDDALAVFFRPVRYIAPVRATAERYYRQQDLAVDEVDPQGANLAMFLQSLTLDEREHFSTWCTDQLGFSVRARTEGAHISLFLQDRDSDVEYNIADMGFGFSQVLPLLAQIWSLSRSVSRRPTSSGYGPRYYRRELHTRTVSDIVAVEQPELHLHPRLQAKVADMFVAAIRLAQESKRALTIIFETHSETIINQLGHLISTKRLLPEEVQVLLFEKLSASSDTKVSLSSFTGDGTLENWPHGFFLAATDDQFELEQAVEEADQ